MKTIYASEIPDSLIQRRDNWRYTWRWIPILGWFYHKYWYTKPMNKWLDDNGIDMILHRNR